jgi:hypothetical protein
MNNQAITENGAVSLASTFDDRLNLFFKTTREMGVLPSKDVEEGQESNATLYGMIDKSWEVNPLDTIKTLFNWRDCRGGKGDHRGFIVAMTYIEGKHGPWFYDNMEIIPEYGSWLDLVKLWHFVTPNGKDVILNFLVKKLKDDNDILTIQGNKGDISLLAKWFPSENSKWDRYMGVKNGRFVMNFCKKLFCVKRVESSHIKTLRKTYITPLRTHLHLVESKMCAKMFTDIKYDTVPSVAMKNYKKAFQRNDTEGFTKYLEQVRSGEKKINAGQVYPHDLVGEYLTKMAPLDPVIEEQWKVIKAKVQATGAFDKSICVCDVSGSMAGTPMEVAIALGLLGLFENKVITFSDNPQLHHVPEGSLHSQVKNLSQMSWGMSTNFEKVMDLILGLSYRNKEDAIKRILIFSDMQFNVAMSSPHIHTCPTSTHFQMLNEKFKKAGLEMPQIVFWNLRGETGDFPVTCDEKGVIMMSGYSPSLLNSIIDGDDITPLSMFLKVIRAPRYDKIVAPTSLPLAP